MPDKDGHPQQDEMELGKVLSALSDPMRWQVIAELVTQPDGSERTCRSFNLPVAKSTLTHHFRVLRESGLIHMDGEHGNRRGVTLRRDDLEARFPGLLDLLAAEVNAGSR
ncbi:ArsR/SmtB family transcription factor [Streptomyces sp. NPDC058232]|uniref:ArsR/SmtB family transcription factor n=1 Tax=Streptomyces sp. NPDC058232 TaxID=3346393 RepID=UPI0036E205B7